MVPQKGMVRRRRRDSPACEGAETIGGTRRRSLSQTGPADDLAPNRRSAVPNLAVGPGRTRQFIPQPVPSLTFLLTPKLHPSPIGIVDFHLVSQRTLTEPGLVPQANHAFIPDTPTRSPARHKLRTSPTRPSSTTKHQTLYPRIPVGHTTFCLPDARAASRPTPAVQHVEVHLSERRDACRSCCRGGESRRVY